jgi:F0F1-type ATP synthase assembly protein I
MAHPASRGMGFKALRGALRISTLGWDLAVPIIGGAMLGHLLNERYNTGPVLTVVLLLLGLMVGAYNVWCQIRLELARDRRMKQHGRMEDRSQ